MVINCAVPICISLVNNPVESDRKTLTMLPLANGVLVENPMLILAPAITFFGVELIVTLYGVDKLDLLILWIPSGKVPV